MFVNRSLQDDSVFGMLWAGSTTDGCAVDVVLVVVVAYDGFQTGALAVYESLAVLTA